MKLTARNILLIAALLLALPSFSQKKPAFVSGIVVDDNELPVVNASITILGQTKGTTTNDSGYFRIKVDADRAFALIFSYAGHKPVQRNFLLNEGEE